MGLRQIESLFSLPKGDECAVLRMGMLKLKMFNGLEHTWGCVTYGNWFLRADRFQLSGKPGKLIMAAWSLAKQEERTAFRRLVNILRGIFGKRCTRDIKCLSSLHMHRPT